jgi:hypothetical protein
MRVKNTKRNGATGPTIEIEVNKQPIAWFGYATNVKNKVKNRFL